MHHRPSRTSITDAFRRGSSVCCTRQTLPRSARVVRKVIDLECLLPADETGTPRQYHEQASHRIGYGDPELLPERPGYGFANYKNIFRKRVVDPSNSKTAEGAPKSAPKPKGQSI